VINTKELEKVMALTMYSAYIKGDNASSLMISSDRPESGKSQSVNKYYGNYGLAYVSDCTAYGLWRDFHKEIESGSIKHLIISEFLAPLSRNKDTVNSFISTLQVLIEEGVMEIHTGFLEPIKLSAPSSLGAIICMPRTAYNRNIQEWVLSGFASRFITLSYKYSYETIDDIFDSIKDREYYGESKIKLSFPSHSVNVDIPPDIAESAKQWVIQKTEELRRTGSGYGFREFKNFLRLLQANVIMENHQKEVVGNRVTVNKEDLSEIIELSRLINADFNAL
jgi:hypothetical protein